GLVLAGEDARAFQRDVHPQLPVWQFGGVPDRRHLDLVAVHDHLIAVHFHLAGETAVHGIIAQQMCVGFHRAQIVHAYHHDVVAPGFHDRAQDKTPDAAETVDRDANGHTYLLKLSFNAARAASAAASAVMLKCL